MSTQEDRTVVSIKANPTLVAMIDSLKISYAKNSRASVMELAVVMLYKKDNPSYASKPTPLPSGVGTPQSLATQKAQARVTNKQAETSANNDAVMQSGSLVARLLSGKLLDTSSLETAYIAYKRCEAVNGMSEPIAKMYVKNIPIYDGNWEQGNEQVKSFCLTHKFAGIDQIFSELDDEKVKKRLEVFISGTILGMERGKIKPSDVTQTLLELLVEKAKEVGYDTIPLKSQMAEGNFIAS